MTAIWWLRRDLRLADNPALAAALERGAVLPLYVHAPHEEGTWAAGSASRAWLHRSLLALAQAIKQRGSRLLVRSGDSEAVLRQLLRESGAQAVFCNRLYEPAAHARDRRVLSALHLDGIEVADFDGNQLLPPEIPCTQAGGHYRIFGAWWRAAAPLLGEPRLSDAPGSLPPVPATLASEPIDSLGLQPSRGRERPFWEHGWQPGEAGAGELLEAFVEGAAHGYAQQRDLPGRVGSSRLSPHLHFGEISPRQALAAVRKARAPRVPQADQDRFATELGWREFAVQTLLANPDYADRSLDRGFDNFRWATPDPTRLRAWQRGETGVPLVDAGMRELWQTGWMHNRVRMVVASFLTKNLRYHWSHGARWFWDTLLDADLANNSQGWQWTAGTGAGAAPYFRVFNPARQGERFDPRGEYVRRWVPEVARLPDKALHAPWEHPAVAGQLAPDYPASPIVDLAASRQEALRAFRHRSDPRA